MTRRVAEGVLNPTPDRLDVARGMRDGEVYTLGWSPRYWLKRGDDERTVTRAALALLTAEPPLAVPATEPDGMDRWRPRLTDAGREWLLAHEGNTR